MKKWRSRIKKLLVRKEPTLLQVYSHPRSGTHFLEAFLANNFYKNKDLSLDKITWGHWSNRKVKQEGNPYGKLFGNHYFADKNNNNAPKIYIVRDGRAVAYSVWKTPNFLHKDISNLSFKAFLRTPIDWYGTPSKKSDTNLTILEHWALHVTSWYALAEQNNNVLIIRYEDLIETPYQQYLKIHEKFFTTKKKLSQNKINVIKKPVGLLPNKAKADTWKNFFDADDNSYFNAIKSKLITNEIKFE
ncbi:sulfotransferase domain-containing protein [Lacinutrix cladophorae]